MAEQRQPDTEGSPATSQGEVLSQDGTPALGTCVCDTLWNAEPVVSAFMKRNFKTERTWQRLKCLKYTHVRAEVQ